MLAQTKAFRRRFPRETGMTLLELIIACTILLILATAALPTARFAVQRRREAELHRDLREMRDAIDRYKDAADRNLIRVEVGTEGYPPDLETLVKGVDLVAQPTGGIAGTGTAAVGTATSGMAGQSAAAAAQGLTPSTGSINTSGIGNDLIRHVRFLRRIPVDPITGKAEWGMRSVQDDPDTSSWGGKDVFDVFSLSSGLAIDGTKYSDW
jgi:general secretion pathway protein G